MSVFHIGTNHNNGIVQWCSVGIVNTTPRSGPAIVSKKGNTFNTHLRIPRAGGWVTIMPPMDTKTRHDEGISCLYQRKSALLWSRKNGTIFPFHAERRTNPMDKCIRDKCVQSLSNFFRHAKERFSGKVAGSYTESICAYLGDWGLKGKFRHGWWFAKNSGGLYEAIPKPSHYTCNQYKSWQGPYGNRRGCFVFRVRLKHKLSLAWMMV